MPDSVELWSRPVASGIEAPLEKMPRLKYSDSWAATRSGIYFTASGPHAPTVSFYDFASRHVRVVRELPEAPAALGGLGISISRDEHWLLYTRTTDWQGDIMMASED